MAVLLLLFSIICNSVLAKLPFETRKVMFANESSNSNTCEILDLNNDGFSDGFLYDNKIFNSKFYFFINDQNSNYELASTYPGFKLHDVTSGKVNNDSFMDIVIGRDDGITILLTDGNGQVVDRVDVNYRDDISQVVLADVNMDGLNDIVGIGGFTPQILTFLNNGQGGFLSPLGSATNNSLMVQSLIAAEINGDGKIDLATVVGGGGVLFQWYAGQGNGRFVEGQRMSTYPAYVAYDLKSADFDKNGTVDIAVCGYSSENYYYGSSSLFLNDGAGNFVLKNSLPLRNSSKMDIGDLDNDGIPEIIVAERGWDCQVLKVNSSGLSYGETVGFNSKYISLGNSDGDKYPDLFGIRPDYELTVNIAENHGAKTNGKHFDHADWRFGPAVDIMNALPCDLDKDGNNDFIVCGFSYLKIFKGIGNGNYITSETLSIQYPTSFALGDINSDGDLDIVCNSGLTHQIFYFKSNGFGGYNPPVAYYTGPQTQGLVAGDWSQDGKTDVACVSKGNRQMVILTNVGGNFQSESINLATIPNQTISGDYDNDGDEDIVICGNSTLLMNNTNGVFNPTVLSIPNTYRAYSNDLNRDGKKDFVFMGATPGYTDGSNYLRIVENLGDNRFTENAAYNCYSDSRVGIGDLDEDGFVDIITNIAPTVSVIMSKSDGYKAHIIGNSEYTEPLPIVDSDNDKHLDLIAPAIFNSSAMVDTYLNRMDNRSVKFKSPTQVVSNIKEIANAGDVDFDGIEDFILLSKNGKRIDMLKSNSNSWQTTASMELPYVSHSIKAIDLDRNNVKDSVLISDEGLETVFMYSDRESTISHCLLSQKPTCFSELDFDLNGTSDLVVGCEDSSLNFVKNLGNGKLRLEHVKYMPRPAQSICAFQTQYRSANIACLASDSNKSFVQILNSTGTLIQSFDVPVGLRILPVKANSDKLDDLLVTGLNESYIYCYNRELSRFDFYTSISVGEIKCELADIDYDGHLEMLLGITTSSKLLSAKIGPNIANSFSEPIQSSYDVVEIGEYTEDARADLWAIDNITSSLCFFEGEGGNYLLLPKSLSLENNLIENRKPTALFSVELQNYQSSFSLGLKQLKIAINSDTPISSNTFSMTLGIFRDDGDGLFHPDYDLLIGRGQTLYSDNVFSTCSLSYNEDNIVMPKEKAQYFVIITPQLSSEANSNVLLNIDLINDEETFAVETISGGKIVKEVPEVKSVRTTISVSNSQIINWGFY